MAILNLRKSHSYIDSVESFAGESAEVVSLSDDMLAEIILRLPVKSAARSKCVSKNWRATISDGYLRRRLRLHLSVVYFPDDPARGNAPRFACAAEDGGRLLGDRGLGFLPFRDGAVVCDACNGLLLLRSGASAGAPRLYVADPVTQRWAELPAPAKPARLPMLAFDPSSSHHFRVVNFTGGWRQRGAEVEVFSSEAWAWAVRDAEFGVPSDALSGTTTHSHAGAVYVLASDPDCVVRMDVDVPGPGLPCAVAELPEPAGADCRLAHSGGRLHYVASDGELIKVWAATEEHSPSACCQWRLKHAIKVDDVVEGRCKGREARLLAMHPEKDAVYVWSPRKLVEYDLIKKKVTGAWEFGKDEKNRVVKTWLVPSSFYLSDCLAGGQLQC